MRRKAQAAKQSRPARRQLSLLELFRGYYAARRTIFLLVFILVPALAWAMGWVQMVGQTLGAKGEQVLVATGFVVNDILVEGRKQADPKTILTAVGSMRGDSIFACDPEQTKDRLEKITWIQSAMVQRRLPNTIYIRLVERNPIAVWQQGGKRFLVDEHGAVIENFNADEFKHLLLISGGEAPRHAKDLLDSFRDFNEVRELVKSAVFISGRRWDLIMKNNIRIKLPERDIPLALKNLQRLVQDRQLEDGRLGTIDLRMPDRSFLTVQETEDDKKNKGKLT